MPHQVVLGIAFRKIHVPMLGLRLQGQGMVGIKLHHATNLCRLNLLQDLRKLSPFVHKRFAT